jgi:predicted nucleotidyltransferase component of viral defense system
VKDTIASIQNKLKNIAQAEGKAYQLILTRYFQERLLFRIFQSPYSSHFFLKGGALLYAFEKEKSRPTLDIDLLAQKISNEKSILLQCFRTICLLVYEADGLVFDLDSLAAFEIAKEGKYSGVRLKVKVSLGNIRQVMQVDIGFGDVMTPGPVQMIYPTLLLSMDSPKVQAYSVETIIAEKFEAMIDLSEMNSRMKDFYDLYRLLKGGNFERKILLSAIINTFRQRQTAYPQNHPLFTLDFANSIPRNQQWKAFLQKSSLDVILEFSDVMQTIREEIHPVYQQMCPKPPNPGQ